MQSHDDNVPAPAKMSLVRDAVDGEPTCCVCTERPACATVMPCMYAQFCYPCIFTIKREGGSCPLCRLKIEKVEFKESCTLEEISDIMSKHDWSFAEDECLDTLEEFAGCFEISTQEMLGNLFFNWTYYRNRGRMGRYEPGDDDIHDYQSEGESEPEQGEE